jgi:electron transport complex protein RnfA
MNINLNSDFFGNIFVFAFTTILLNNIFFSFAFGGSSLLLISGGTQEKKYTLGFCASVIWLMTFASFLTFFTDRILQDFAAIAPYLRIPIYTVILGLCYILTLVLLSGIMSSRFDNIKKYIHTAAFNSAVFGCILTAADARLAERSDLLSYIFYGLFTGLGFALALIINSAVSKLTNADHMPKSFKGYPATLIFLGFMGMAFYGI